VDAELTLDQGHEAAQFTALNVLTQIQRRLGSLQRLHHIVHMEGASSAERFF
jgi:hypothetical protein